jgi:twitching motility protein PilT
MASLVDRINKNRACHIITIEDPIEYVHNNKKAVVEQREVNADTLSFSNALKYVLRQDPDVILVGEMRDTETIASALTAAETGHLVMATLHTNDAPQSIDRIIDSFPAHQQNQIRLQLSSALLGIVSQRLLPKRDGSGRIAAFEILAGTHGAKALIREGKTHQVRSVMETGAKDGMITMEKALTELYNRNIISRETMNSYLLVSKKAD